MSLHRLVYLSRAVQPLPINTLNSLSLRARKRNEDHGITSLLLYDGRYFLHYAEGPAASLTWLLQNVRQDPRHEDLCLLSHHPCQTRTFPSWALNIVNLTHGGGLVQLNAQNTHHSHPDYSIRDLLNAPLPGDMRLLVASFAASSQMTGDSSSLLNHN